MFSGCDIPYPKREFLSDENDDKSASASKTQQAPPPQQSQQQVRSRFTRCANAEDVNFLHLLLLGSIFLKQIASPGDR